MTREPIDQKTEQCRRCGSACRSDLASVMLPIPDRPSRCLLASGKSRAELVHVGVGGD